MCLLALVLGLALSGCQTWRSYRADAGTKEHNVSLVLDRNQAVLTAATLGGRAGRLVLATASPRTMVDDGFLAPGADTPFAAGQGYRARVAAVSAGLRPAADALIGFDAFGSRKISLDYSKGLLTVAESRVAPPEDMHVRKFSDIPRVSAIVDGREYLAVVDSSLPDTIVIPASSESRSAVPVTIQGVDLGAVDVHFAPVSEARLGNRILARFLVTIDYSRKWIGLWPDPRYLPVVPRQADLALD